jgi:hypothetical protein
MSCPSQIPTLAETTSDRNWAKTGKRRKSVRIEAKEAEQALKEKEQADKEQAAREEAERERKVEEARRADEQKAAEEKRKTAAAAAEQARVAKEKAAKEERPNGSLTRLPRSSRSRPKRRTRGGKRSFAGRRKGRLPKLA